MVDWGETDWMMDLGYFKDGFVRGDFRVYERCFEGIGCGILYWIFMK